MRLDPITLSSNSVLETITTKHRYSNPSSDFARRAQQHGVIQVTLGGHSTLDPPLPISNRTVKRSRADDSAYYVCESRSPPGSPQHKPSPHPRRGLRALKKVFSDNHGAPRTLEVMGVLVFASAGLPALQRGKLGQVRKEAATAIYCECRGKARHFHFCRSQLRTADHPSSPARRCRSAA